MSYTPPPSADPNRTVEEDRLSIPLTEGIESLILLNETEILMPDPLAAIGSGGFGVVFKGKYQHMDVAVKSFTSQQSITEAHRKEMILMKSLNHVNIVRLYGLVCDEQRRPTKLVMEYGSCGDLHSFIVNNRKNNTFIPWELRTKIAYDLACGLSYLHSKHVVHRDIKSQNVVLDMNGTAKWCDFGLSVLKLSSTPMYQQLHRDLQAQAGNLDLDAQIGGTLIYLAPELFVRSTSEPSRASDIWAYGMVCYELVSMKLPFEDEILQYRPNHQPIVKQAIVSRSPPLQLPADCLMPFHTCISNCWNPILHRKNAGDIAYYWANILDQMLPRQPSVVQQQQVSPIDLLMQAITTSWAHSRAL